MRAIAGAVAALVIGGLVGAHPVFAHGKRSGERMSAAQIEQAQQKLRDDGYDPGPVDGKMGPQTRHAVKKFQQAKDLKASGRLDRQTVAALGIEGATSGTSGPSGRMH